MKKFFIAMCVALFAISAQAQKRGEFAVGLQTNETFSKVEFLNVKENSNKWGIGAFGQYSITNHWRLEADLTFHPMKDHMSDFLAALEMQYVFHVSDKFKIYPSLGYALSFVHRETYTEKDDNGSITFEGNNDTDGGIQLGLGFQYNLKNDWFIKADYKFQPGIFGDAHCIMFGVGYKL